MDIEIINTILPLIKSQTSVNVVLGTNIPENSLCLRWRSNPSEVYMSKDSYNSMTVLLNGKNIDQQAIATTLNAIHHYLNKLKQNQIPIGENTQIINIQTSSSPELIGVEENGQWIYGSSLLVTYYIR